MVIKSSFCLHEAAMRTETRRDLSLLCPHEISIRGLRKIFVGQSCDWLLFERALKPVRELKMIAELLVIIFDSDKVSVFRTME